MELRVAPLSLDFVACILEPAGDSLQSRVIYPAVGCRAAIHIWLGSLLGFPGLFLHQL